MEKRQIPDQLKQLDRELNQDTKIHRLRMAARAVRDFLRAPRTKELEIIITPFYSMAIPIVDAPEATSV